MEKYVVVGLGGFLGAIARFWLGGYIGSKLRHAVPVRDIRDQLFGFVSDWLYSHASGRKDPLEPQLEIFDTRWVHRCIHNVFDIRV